MGMFPEGVAINHYLTDSDAFFVRTNVPQGMKMFQRVKAEFAQDGDFDTGNLKYKGYERYSVGWTDWRALFGSPGCVTAIPSNKMGPVVSLRSAPFFCEA
jgi:hypothetical protein